MFSRLNPFKRQEAQVEMDKQADTAARMSEAMIAQYRQGLSARLNDPGRLAAVYGHEFASASFRQQAFNIATQARSMLNVPNAMVSMVTATEQVQVAAAVEGAPERLACQEGYCENVIGLGREFAVENAGEHALVCHTDLATNQGVISYLGVPIVVDEQIVGVLCSWDSKPRHWGVADVSILTSLASVLSHAVTPATPA